MRIVVWRAHIVNKSKQWLIGCAAAYRPRALHPPGVQNERRTVVNRKRTEKEKKKNSSTKRKTKISLLLENSLQVFFGNDMGNGVGWESDIRWDTDIVFGFGFAFSFGFA